MDSLNIEKIQSLVRNHWEMDKYDIMCLFQRTIVIIQKLTGE